MISYLTKTSEKYATKWTVLCIDLVLLNIAFILAYYVRFLPHFNFDHSMLLLQLPVVTFLGFASFLICGSYKGIIRHTGIKDIKKLIVGLLFFAFAMAIITFTHRFFNGAITFTIPLSIIIIHFLLAFVGLSVFRYLFKALYQYHLVKSGNKIAKNLLIFGASNSGILTYNAITNQTTNNNKVVGYIDDDPTKAGKILDGIKIYNLKEITNTFIQEKNISEIIYASPNISQKKLRAQVESLMKLSVKVKITPSIDQWINGELKPSQIKQLQIEDLLGRSPIAIENCNFCNQIKDKVVFITGGAGSIGSELVRQISLSSCKQLVVLDQCESAIYELGRELKQKNIDKALCIVADIHDSNRMEYFFEQYKPDFVFHAAAYKHVPLMEVNYYEAIKTNVAGTKIVTDLASKYKVEKFVLISTDKAVNPTSVMGATKRVAEMYVTCKQQQSDTKFIITRFGNVLGSSGSVIPVFKKQIEQGGPLTVTHKDITRYFMTIPEASRLVLEAGSMGKGGEIYIFDMGEPVKIFDLAKNMINLSGYNYPKDIQIKITGLRPGEKLYEELLANGENNIPTHHKKIMISRVCEFNYFETKFKIEELCRLNRFFNTNTIKLMKDIVPEYISNNSELCKFDEIKQKEQELAKQNKDQEVKVAAETSKVFLSA